MPRRRVQRGSDDAPEPLPITPVPLKEATFQMRKYVQGLIRDQSSVSQTAIEQAAFDRFRNERNYMERLLRENIRAVVTSVVQGVISSTRTRPMVIHGDEVVDRAVLVARLESASDSWSTWLEWTGDRHVRLPQMTAEDLEAAAAIREERGTSDFHRAGLWRRLAARLRADRLSMVGDIPDWSQFVEKQSIGIQVDVSTNWRDFFDWQTDEPSDS